MTTHPHMLRIAACVARIVGIPKENLLTPRQGRAMGENETGRRLIVAVASRLGVPDQTIATALACSRSAVCHQRAAIRHQRKLPPNWNAIVAKAMDQAEANPCPCPVCSGWEGEQ